MGAKKAPKGPPPPEDVGRVTAIVLADRLKVSHQTIGYAVKRGQLSPPGADHQFDLAQALREWALRPKRNTRKEHSRVKPLPGRARRPVSAEAAAAADDNPEGYDPDTRYRLAKARQEEMKLARLRGETLDAKVTANRVFAIFRLVRDRLNGWVAQAAPLVAAAVQAPEALVYQAITAQMRRLEDQLATLDLDLMLMREPDGDEETEEEAVE